MELKVILEKDVDSGYIIYVPSLPGCISQGETKKEALFNIKEAIELYLEAETNDLIEFSGEEATILV